MESYCSYLAGPHLRRILKNWQSALRMAEGPETFENTTKFSEKTLAFHLIYDNLQGRIPREL